MALEVNFKNKLLDEMSRRGFFVYATHNTIRAGVPDVHAVLVGKAYWIELKVACKFDNNKATLQHRLGACQSKFLRDVADAGGFGAAMIELPDGDVGVVTADKLSPGPHRSFEILEPLSLVESIEWISKFATESAS